MESSHKNSELDLFEAMKRPEFYPNHPSRVEVEQTHMSYVFLADDYVYKVKKPVHFDFADCSSLGTRYQLCCGEVRLNRRLAHDVYIGVLPIFRDGSRFFLGEESSGFDPKAHEYTIKMRRLPHDRMLDQLVRRDNVTTEIIDALVNKMAAFHRDVFATNGWRYGSASSVQTSVLENLSECERFVGDSLSRAQFNTIDVYFKDFIAAHHEMLNHRAREGYVRDGHGDLRCEHICLTRGIQIFDCLEFSERLRCTDVASEIGFLAMDLDSLGAPFLADQLVHSYATLTADEGFAILLNFYQCHRACIRGKVESLKSLENEVPPQERKAARGRALIHFSLASRYAQRGRPIIVVVCGLSGTGKSSVSRKLQYRTGYEIINSDRVRKRIGGVAKTFRGDNGYASGIYSERFDKLTYQTLVAETINHLRDGRGVIIDATFKRKEDRQTVLAAGDQLGVPVLFVECRAEDKEILRRLRDRAIQNLDVSDATEDVYLRQRAKFAPLDEISTRHHLVVDTTSDTESVLTVIEQSIVDLNTHATQSLSL